MAFYSPLSQLPPKLRHPIHPELTHTDITHPYFSLIPTKSRIKRMKQYLSWSKEVGAGPDMAFRNFVKEVLIHNINDKFDNVITIVSIEGVGKSTVEFWLGALLSVFLDCDFDMQTDLAYNLTDFHRLLKSKSFSIIGLDEGTKALNKYETQTKGAKETMKLMTQARFHYNTILICSPRFKDLHEYIADHRVYINLRLIQRGYAKVEIKRIDEDEDPWSDDEPKRKKKAPPRGNTWGVIWCPPIPPSIEKDYIILKEKNYQDTETELETFDKSQLFGIYLTKALHDFFDSPDKINSYIEKNSNLKNLFSYQQIEKLISEASNGTFKISDAYLRELVERIKPLKK